MANESKILWGSVTDITLTNLASLADGNWWQSGELNDASPSSELIRIWWEIVFNATPVAGDFLWFKVARGDGAASNEIWDAGVGTSEGQVTAAASKAAIEQSPMPTWTHYWATNHGATFKGSRMVPLHGHSWQLLVSPRGEALAAGTHRLRYQVGTPQLQA